MKGNNKIDFLALKYEGFGSDTFERDVLSYSKNSILYFSNHERFFLIYKPNHIKWIPSSVINYPRLANRRLHWFLMPFFGLYGIMLYMFVFGYLCVRFRPKVCWTENTWVAATWGVAKKMGLCKYSIYFIGDWLETRINENLISYLANNLLWRVFDYMAATLSDLMVNLTKEIGEARDRFWGKTVAKRSYISFPPSFIVDNGASRQGTHICFLGQVRSDSGLELLLPLLPELNRKYGTRLKIIGPQSPHREFIERQLKSRDLEQFVDLAGWVEAGDIGKVMGDCFCGVNLIISDNSHTSYTIPGKLAVYFQNLLPVLVTGSNGPFTQIIRQDGLGLVIEPTSDQIIGAIDCLYAHQADYRENIKKYAEKYPAKKISDYVEMASGRSDR